MNKSVFAVGCLCAGAVSLAASDLSVSATFAWESDYIFRGVRLADEYFAPSVDVSYGDFYAGVWAALPVESPAIDGEIDSETDLYGGYGLGINDAMSADFGFTYYTYTGGLEDTFEIYAGLSFEVPLSPAIYVFYDFDLEAFTFEGSAGYMIELTDEHGVELSSYLGYVEPDEGDSYAYFGFGAAYTYAFTENASASFGVNYYANEDTLVTDSSSSKFTLTASFTAGF